MWDLIVSVPDHCLSFYFSCRAYYGPCMDKLVTSLGCSTRQNTGHSGYRITESSTHKSPDVTSSLTRDLFKLLRHMTLYAFKRNQIKFNKQSKKMTWS